MIRWTIVAFLITLLPCFCPAQGIEDELPTNTTAFVRVDHRRYEPKERTFDYVYTRDTKNTLYGNPCAVEVTQGMGFLFVPLTGDEKTAFGYFLNNLYVKGKLSIIRTPFWRLILNKRLKDCRLSSGDGVG